VIFGDGYTSRDFTYIDNVVEANIKALFTQDKSALNNVYNIAFGGQTSLNDVVNYLGEISGKDIKPVYKLERPGDVKHSKADISKATQLLGYEPRVNFFDGLKKVYNWYTNNYSD
jgi:UDP-N-acetylglucosamine 4-epimerase